MNEISQTIKESCFSCKNIAQISIWMILVVSKCSINDVKSLISLIFRGPQTPHVTTIFEKILQTILFYVNESACHILGTICDTSKFTSPLASVNLVMIKKFGEASKDAHRRASSWNELISLLGTSKIM